jgi:hypothetical protein
LFKLGLQVDDASEELIGGGIRRSKIHDINVALEKEANARSGGVGLAST